MASNEKHYCVYKISVKKKSAVNLKNSVGHFLVYNQSWPWMGSTKTGK